MLEQIFVRPGVIARLRRSPLGPHLDAFATSLHHAGYASSSIQRFLCAAEQFAHWLHGQGYAVCEMDEALLRAYLSGLTRYRSGNLPKAAQGLGHLVRFLQRQASRVHGKTGCPISPLDQWLAPMMPILSKWQACPQHPPGLSASCPMLHHRLFWRGAPRLAVAHRRKDHDLCQPRSLATTQRWPQATIRRDPLVPAVFGLPRGHPHRIRGGRSGPSAVAVCLAPVTPAPRGRGTGAGRLSRWHRHQLT